MSSDIKGFQRTRFVSTAYLLQRAVCETTLLAETVFLMFTCHSLSSTVWGVYFALFKLKAICASSS